MSIKHPINTAEKILHDEKHVKTLQSIYSRILIFGLLFVGVFVGFLIYWSFQSEEILIIKNSPFPSRIVADPATGGNIVFLKVDYCKNSDVTGKVRTSFISRSREVFLPLADESQKAQCLDREIPVLVPKELPPDVYKIKFRTTYNINPIKRNIINEFESKEFEIK